MKPYETPPPTTLTIFGAGGDLAWRKLVPALYNLFLDGWLPDGFTILGVDRREMSKAEFREHLYDGVQQFSRQEVEAERWQAFAAHLDYLSADFANPATYERIRQGIEEDEGEWSVPTIRIFYLATPPSVMGMVVEGLEAAGLHRPPERARIVVEKPFGHDLPSARALNRTLLDVFEEQQIYRIDHYLGKETVQNLLALRFANLFWEPIWDRRYIEHIQITVAESVGVGHRADYYEKVGALRDMIQNHLMQLLTLVAMEPMVSFSADEIRNKKLDVLRAVRPIQPEQVERVAVRGQYGAGEIGGEAVPAYRDAPDVAPDSTTETYVALKLHVDNWRWQGVPFYLRTGKRLPRKDSEIVVRLRAVPHRAFPRSMVESNEPNQLVIHIQPTEGLDLYFRAKVPGPAMCLAEADLNFRYVDDFHQPLPDAYETLLLDVMLGDATLFMRADEVEAAWAIVQPILDHWSAHPPTEPFPNYAAGTWGPQAAEDLLVHDEQRWVEPR
ncbi:MAG: glucose-6-phosphate dehydrogenase [Chloroflexota bacterium]|nr:glucose-6-phosphate dehydrogenase [Chloroflexota bacterium]